jgi:D-alanine-D-alanine ligase
MSSLMLLTGLAQKLPVIQPIIILIWLNETARACWILFDLKGYARVDVRADSNGNIFVIEINANPCISPDGGFVAATRQAGYPFTAVLDRIISDLN